MPEFKLNGKTYSGSTNYASAITYTEDDGSKTTVQDKISELNSNMCGIEFVLNEDGTIAGYKSGGADTVYPFKSGIDTSDATATAGNIAKGYTAYVNGEKITGTAILIDASSGYVILNSSNASAGSEITGGWTPSGTFRAEKNATVAVQSNNLIDLTNISHVDFTYQFTNLANDGDLGSSYCSVYLIDTSGTTLKTVTNSVSSKGIGTFSGSINTADLKGNYRIGYKLYTYYTSTDKGSWTERDGAYAYINRISLF